MLIVFTTGMIMSPLLYRSLLKKEYSSWQADSLRLDSLIGLMSMSPVDQRDHGGKDGNQDSIFGFDPNYITFHQMILLGIDTLIARRILKFRDRGGSFVTKEDLLRIYDLPDSMYERLRYHIQLPERIIVAQNSSRTDRSNVYDRISLRDSTVVKGSDIPENVSLDINAADTGDFMKIRGIGPVLSRRIIKYRELLGGYFNIGQLDSVYGLKGEVLQYLKSVAYIDSLFKPVTIQINYGTWKELVRHPYVNSQLANDIINLRSEKGYLKDVDDLKSLPNMRDSLLVRLRPYLEF